MFMRKSVTIQTSVRTEGSGWRNSCYGLRVELLPAHGTLSRGSDAICFCPHQYLGSALALCQLKWNRHSFLFLMCLSLKHYYSFDITPNISCNPGRSRGSLQMPYRKWLKVGLKWLQGGKWPWQIPKGCCQDMMTWNSPMCQDWVVSSFIISKYQTWGWGLLWRQYIQDRCNPSWELVVKKAPDKTETMN